MISGSAAGRAVAIAEPLETGIAYTVPQAGVTVESIRVRTPEASGRPGKQPKNIRQRVLRRLRGLLIEKQGTESRVAFVENDQPIQYYLPTDRLRMSGIVAQNQPFEMDEVEIQVNDGVPIVGYRFRPSARPSDSFVDSIDLDEERKQKRALIFKKFGKAKS